MCCTGAVGMTWRVLGPVTAEIDDAEVELNLRPRSVLLVLLLHPNRAVSWERVASFLWGDEPPKTQRNSVARFVADLRRALGAGSDRVVTEGGSYRLVVNEGELDIDVVRDALATASDIDEARLGPHHDQLANAMGIAGLSPNPWLANLFEVEPILHEHEELQIEVLTTLADLKLRTARHNDVIALLRRGIDAHPFHENLWAQLVLALHRAGRTAEALRECRRLRTLLIEIGLEPAEEILRLESQIAVSAPGLAVSVSTTMLESPTGRDTDHRTLGSALAASTVVTVVGVAGAGKSQLAAAVALDEELSGVNVYRVNLRSITHASRVIPAIAAAVGVPPSEALTTPDELAARLAPVAGLIVLDNCEHLRPECADLALAMMNTAMGIRLLMTSREPMRIDGETVFRLEMLSTALSSRDGWPTPAATLFVDRLGRDELDASERGDVEAICVATLGHPRAIELAAGLARYTTLSELRASLEATAVSSSAFATAAVLDLAWRGLSASEQGLLARLSVFAGGCPIDGAEAVCGESGSIAEELAQLVSRGLVQNDPGGRFLLDSSVQTFAAARLSERRESTIVRDRMVSWLLSLTARWRLGEVPVFAAASRMLLPEHTNVSAALTHLRGQHRFEEATWFAFRCCGLWINYGMHGELVEWLSPAVDDTTLTDAARSAAATAMLEADLTVGNYDDFSKWGTMAVGLARGEPHDWVAGLTGFLALWSLVAPMPMSTSDLLDLAEDTARRSESHDVNLANALLRRAQIAHHHQDFNGAVDYFRQGLALVDEEGRLLLALEMGETISLYLAGRHDEALESTKAWRSQARTDEWHYQVDIVGAIIRGGCGEPETATAELAEAVRNCKPIAVWARADEFQIAFGLLAAYRGEPMLADGLLSTAKSGSPFLNSIVVEHQMAGKADPVRRAELNRESRERTVPIEALTRETASQSELESWWQTGHVAAEAGSDIA